MSERARPAAIRGPIARELNMTIYRPIVEESEVLGGDGFEAEAAIYQEEQSDEALIESLATELLAVTTDQELDYFLGGLFKKVKAAVKSPAGQALFRIVRPLASTVVRKLIPMAATAVGSAVGGPLGTAAGGLAGMGLNAIAGKLGLEVEGLSEEDQTFEIAKGFSRFLHGAVTNLASVAPQAARNPVKYARDAAITAARQTAPGLVPFLTGGGGTRQVAMGSGAPRLIRLPGGPGRFILEIGA